MTAAKTVAERQEALKQRRRAAGLKEYRNLWGHPDDEEATRAYVARLLRKRQREAGKGK